MYLPETRLNLDKSSYDRETLGYRRMQTNGAEFKGLNLGPEKCFCLTNCRNTVRGVILQSCLRDRWTTGNLGGEILRLLGVCVHTRSPITQMYVPALGCLSAGVCTNECVGTSRSSRGRMPFPHPSLPIISRPDKTPVCWRLQDQTVMSRQLFSQHTADVRWLSLS